MGLFNFGKKQTTRPTRPATNSFGEPIDKLVDGELPWGWYARHKDYLRGREQEMTSLAVTSSSLKDKEARINKLKKLISYFYEFKVECESKGECFKKYFNDMWMHCHNTRNPDFIYIAPYETELKKLLE